MVEVVLFGHITIDTIVKGNRRWSSIGGTVVYGSFAALRYGATPIIVSKVGEDFLDEYLIFLSRSNVDITNVKVRPGTKTTRFKLTYRDSERELVVSSVADRITRWDADLVELDGRVAIVGPVAGEVELDALESIHSRAALTALDVQGYLRRVAPKKPVRLTRSEAALRALRHADIVHADEDEAEVLTGAGPDESARWMVAQGVKVALVTMGSHGSYVAYGNKLAYVPAYKDVQVVDETGAGDVFLTVFTLEYHAGSPVERAAAMASAAVSYLVERPGLDGLRERRLLQERAEDILAGVEAREF